MGLELLSSGLAGPLANTLHSGSTQSDVGSSELSSHTATQDASLNTTPPSSNIAIPVCSIPPIDVKDPAAVKTKATHTLPPNLDLYIPVGILRRRVLVSDTEDQNSGVKDSSYPHAELASLEKHQWIQTESYRYADHPDWTFTRVFLLPDDKGRKIIPRSSTSLRRALRLVMSRLDTTAGAWEGQFDSHSVENSKTNIYKTITPGEEDSLWYIFNTLENPNPDVGSIQDTYGRRAMEDILCNDAGYAATAEENSSVIGLKTRLYPYQRRSAATMIQREVQPARTLDPRLQAHLSPTGQEYYYDKEEGTILSEKRLYSEACGGILAETMGCGKTLICLAVILATRGHLPRIPTEYQDIAPDLTRTHTGSLLQMAAAAAGRYSIPWKSHFHQLTQSGMNYDRCTTTCEQNCAKYIIPPPPSRYQSRVGSKPKPPDVQITLCSGTLIIVPPNLFDHWKQEIATHTEGLQILYLRTGSDQTPSADELMKYDVVLFSRIRFEKEAGETAENRQFFKHAEYVSPLRKLHWLRIIVDEGHNVAGHGHKTSTVHMLDQLHVERRWVVSGTPSNGLYGVEVSLASQETMTSDTEMPDRSTSSVLQSRRKTGKAAQEELKDVDKLRLIVVEFLKLKPWSNSRADDPASWAKYIKPAGEDGKRRKAPSLRAVLQSLVVRHGLDVINEELPLPKLHNKVIYLEPTFYDKMSINIFLVVLAVNAITSERKDQDYMFHPRNRKHLSLTINNLRQAGFWWTGFERKDIETTLKNAKEYMEKHIENMSPSDVDLLSQSINIANSALDCQSWGAFCEFDEMGVFVRHFPDHARGLWALDSSNREGEALLLGISQARLAQKFVTSHLNTVDPAEGLAGAGIKARREIAERSSKKNAAPSETPSGSMKQNTADNLVHKPKPELKSPKKTFSKGLFKSLPVDSPLSETKVVATSSAKLTYLLDRVLELHKTEKIIIFYENNNSAFWIAEGLEMLGIEFRIYANTLKTNLKAAYLTLFDESETVRVLLMDLRQASHGLHVASASRVFIVNPIWRPNVESQAIKRAHRIGQTRPVFVETLVLKDTLEDKMMKRRKEMSSSEAQHAEKDMLEDSTMSAIIQNERFIPMDDDELATRAAYFERPTGFFDRHTLPIPDSQEGGYLNTPPRKGNATLNISMTSPSSSSKSNSPTKRKLSHSNYDKADAIPWIESDLSIAEGDSEVNESPSKRRRPRSSPIQIITEDGIIMTPPRSSRSSPYPQISQAGSLSGWSPRFARFSPLPVTASPPAVQSLFGGASTTPTEGQQ